MIKLLSVCTAPLGAILCERFSERKVLIGSSLLSFIGCMVTAFAQNIETVVLGTGVLMGAGMSCFFGPVEITIGRYFHKRKSFAIALTMAGMSLSQIVMPPINVVLMEEYALQGTLLLYSGFLLNIMVAAALIRPSETRNEATEDTMDTVQLKTTPPPDTPTTPPDTPTTINPSDSDKPYLSLKYVTVVPTDRNNPQPKIYYEKEISGQEKQLFVDKSLTETCVGFHKERDESEQERMPNDSAIKRCLGTFVAHFEFNLLKNVQFTCYLTAYCLSSVPFLNIPIYFFPRAEDCHLNAGQSALLLTVMGTAAFGAQILLGILGDISCLGSSFIFTCGIFCFGVSSACVILTKNFMDMAIIAGFLGLFNNATSTLNMPILVDIVGLEKLPRALALISVIFGIINAVAPPLLGYFKDITLSYDGVYVVLAGMLLLGTAIMLTEKVARCIKSKKK